MPAKASDIIQHQEADPAGVTWLAQRGPQAMEVVEAKAEWASAFGLVAQQLRGALDEAVLVAVEHVGWTAVPGLAAKDVLDMDPVVADPADEGAYAGRLEEAGFCFLRREPAWQQHRLFVRERPPHGQPVNLDVFGPDAPELVRHRLLRNHLRTHDADRARDGGGGVPEYNERKQAVIRDMLDRVYRETGLVTP